MHASLRPRLLDVKYFDVISLDIETSAEYSFDIKIFELEKLDGKEGAGMRQMDALTELELAAARRREVMLADRPAVRARRQVERVTAGPELGRMATAKLALGSRLARG